MDTTELLRKVRKIEIKTQGLSKNIFAGQYHSAFKGRGMAFSEVREYQYGDDVRDIEWNVTGRFHHPYVKVFEEERELTVMLLVDVSGSLDFGTREQMKRDRVTEIAATLAFSAIQNKVFEEERELTVMLLVDVSGSLDFGTREQMKRDRVTEIAATLAFSAIQNNDKVGVIFFSDQIEKYIAPSKGRKHILYCIREMLTFKPESKRTDIKIAIEYLTKVLKRRCTAFLISDFYTKINFEQSLTIANKKHDVVAIQVYDERAKELPDVGLMKVIDAETNHQMYIDTHDKRLRKAHRDYWENRNKQLDEVLNQSRVDVVSIATNDDYVKMLMALFSKRSR